MLVEFVKHPIRLVECGTENLKITTTDDMIIARTILESRMADQANVETEGEEA